MTPQVMPPMMRLWWPVIRFMAWNSYRYGQGQSSAGASIGFGT